VRCCSSRI